MQIGVAYSELVQQVWLRIEEPEETTVEGPSSVPGSCASFPASI